MVWGGLALAQDSGNTSVTTATAAGKAANACELSSTQSGMIYTVQQADAAGQDKQATGISLGGHSLATPVVHDGHMIMLTADGKVLVRGDPNAWNNEASANVPGRVRVHMWDADTSGTLKP
jgi:type IV pilus assembly protein PilY1